MTAPRVLFVGNSLTFRPPHDLPGAVARLVPALQAQRLVEDGASLREHLASGRLARALASSRSDLVVLQDYSVRPLEEPEGFHADARLCAALVREQGARLAFFAPWLGVSRTRDEWERVAQAYEAAGRELGAPVARVGRAWRAALDAGLALHEADEEHAGPLGSDLAALVVRHALFMDAPEPAGFERLRPFVGAR